MLDISNNIDINQFNSLTIHTRNYGFFSCLLQILDNLQYCENYKIKPILTNLGSKFAYAPSNIENQWNLFFENINDGKPTEKNILIESIPNIDNNFYFLLDNFIIIRSHSNSGAILWKLLGNKSDNITQYRYLINKLILKYIKPINPIQLVIDNFTKNNNINSNTLGVHVRGSDFEFYDIKKYIYKIEQLLENNLYESIYIASDNDEAIIDIKNYFHDIKCVFFNSFRFTNIQQNIALYHSIPMENRVSHAKEAIIESYLLSRCGGLVCINSGFSLFSCLLNPQMPIYMIGTSHRGDGG